MNTFFREGKNDIGWMGSNFKEHFSEMEVVLPKEATFTIKKLERGMTDKEILAELKPNECTLGDLAYAMKNDLLDKENYNANIFYIRDKSNTLWAVDAYWLSVLRYWLVLAASVADPRDWRAGYQVVSRDSLKLGDSDSSEPLTLCISEITLNGKRYKLTEIE